MSLTASERSILADISLDAPWNLVETFSTMPRWLPEDVNRGADVIIQSLQALNMSVDVYEPTIFLSIPIDASVTVGGIVLRAKPPSMSVSVPEGVEGALVYLDADEEKFRSYTRNPKEIFKDGGVDGPSRVRGKIAVLNGFANPGTCSLLEEWGAIGMIAINPGVDIHWGTCTTIWGSPDLDDLPRKPTIAVVAVSNPDGQALIRAAGKGESACIKTEMMEGWYPQKVPVVTIPGTQEPDRFVLVHGHYDSWDVGVGDNATGDATLLELARVLHKNRSSLRRSVRIAWWPGHSTGRYAGSTWFADHFALDLDANCVAQINCDSPGCRWATLFKDVSWTKETEGYAKDVIKAVAGLEAHGERPHRAGDYSFNNIGISSLLMLSSTMPDELRAKKGYYTVGGCGGNIAWHTENDLLDIADKDILLRDMKVYLEVVASIADADILPFDWRAQVAEFSDTIASYQKAAGKAFDLSPAASATQSLDKVLADFYKSAAKGKVTLAKANHVIQRLARILVPINYTRVPRFRHDPALPVPALPTLSAASEIKGLDKVKQGFARTQLVRGQNRYIAALREAEALVAATLS